MGGVGTGQMRKNNYALIAMISPGNETKRSETRRAPTKIELKNANELQWRTPLVRGGVAGGWKRVLRFSRAGVSRHGTRYGRAVAAVTVRTVGTIQVPTTWHSGANWQINRQLF